MREAGEEYLAAYPRFTSIDGSAEATTLGDSSVISSPPARLFIGSSRKPLAANFRASCVLMAGSPWSGTIAAPLESGFAHAYEDLLQRFGTDYSRVKDSYPRRKIFKRFSATVNSLTRELSNHQIFDLEGLRGRLRSSSYAPAEGHPNFAPMIAELDNLFYAHQQEDRVRMEFSTWIYLGQLHPGGQLS